jgi:hypothetical protein
MENKYGDEKKSLSTSLRRMLKNAGARQEGAQPALITHLDRPLATIFHCLLRNTHIPTKSGPLRQGGAIFRLARQITRRLEYEGS